jgi:uncharacterized protein YbaR (Trm112 family)
MDELGHFVNRGSTGTSLLTQLGETQFPPALTDELKADPLFLERLHRMLVEFEVIEGKLVCPLCQRVYPIVDGIPNIKMFHSEV